MMRAQGQWPLLIVVALLVALGGASAASVAKARRIEAREPAADGNDTVAEAKADKDDKDDKESKDDNDDEATTKAPEPEVTGLVNYGPKKCVSVGRSKQGHCIMK